MKGFDLTPSEIQALRAAHRSAKSKKNVTAAYKINSIILLGTGWSLQEVSEALLLDEDTLSSYVKKYKADGFSGLLEVVYKGGFKKLSSSQIELLCAELDSNVYLNAKAICLYVKNQFNVDYTIGGMTDLLHHLDYVYKKPKLDPANPDPNAQDLFLEQYIEFMENKPKDSAVLFVDAIHPVHNVTPAYGWIKKGVAQELKSNPGRNHLNIHGAMNAETFETTIIGTEDSINAETTVQLFQYLEKIYCFASVIYVILDNAGYHYSKAVQEYIKTSKIKLIFQPPYSPELNLIERLWKVFKKNVLYNKFYENYEDFKSACFGFFKNQVQHVKEIESIMGDGLEALV
jgi:transposase